MVADGAGGDSLEACVQYAKYCASGKEKVVITL